MIKTIVDYQINDCTNKMHNQLDDFPEIWSKMLDSPSCSIELPVQSYTPMMLISIF